jgi:hypothetical protein
MMHKIVWGYLMDNGLIVLKGVGEPRSHIDTYDDIQCKDVGKRNEGIWVVTMNIEG